MISRQADVKGVMDVDTTETLHNSMVGHRDLYKSMPLHNLLLDLEIFTIYLRNPDAT
jgi:hypothetical protein